jgi:hypothetical protein
MVTKLIGLTLGIVFGAFGVWQLLRWIFDVQWFGYRLRLVRDAT